MELMTAEEIAEILKTSPEFVYKNRNVLGGIKIGRLVRFPKEVFERIIEMANDKEARKEMQVRFFEGRSTIKGGGGFSTKVNTINAEAGAEVKTINTDLSKICMARLDDIKSRRTDGYFLENKRLFEKLMDAWEGFPKIGTEDVEAYLHEVAKTSKPVANKHLRLIKALFNHGVKRKWFQFNPAVGIEMFGVPRRKKYIPPTKDVEKVLELANEEQRKYLLIVSHTLARVREINKLRWDDVNLDEGYVILRTRKSKNSDIVERKVPMTGTVKGILSSFPRVGDYVFMNPRTGKRYQYRRKFLHNLCIKARVRPFMYHALRHYGASRLNNAGAPLTDIQEILGHQRATTTDIYLQSLKGSVQETIKKLDDFEGRGGLAWTCSTPLSRA